MVSILLLALASFDVQIESGWKDYELGIASTYHPWDTSDWTVPNGRYACNGKRIPKVTDKVCAHRTAPCGSRLRMRSAKTKYKWSECTVMDRGPYGACVKSNSKSDPRRCPEGYYYKVARKPPVAGFYRGIVDATPEVHRGFRGNLNYYGFVKVEMQLWVQKVTVQPKGPLALIW